MPTMAGRPTLSGPSKSVRLLELEATSNNANSRQASQRALGAKRWASVWGGQQQATAGGTREDAQQQSNSGHPGLDLCSGVFGGFRSCASGQQRFWESSLLAALAVGAPACCVMSLRCGLRGPQALGPSKLGTSRARAKGWWAFLRRCGFWQLSGRAARVKTLEGRITVITSNEDAAESTGWARWFCTPGQADISGGSSCCRCFPCREKSSSSSSVGSM